jgi:DNA (cytosine-5)-methyltransferase 1
MKEPLTFIDLFAGAGGFSLGFHQAGMKGIFAIERDAMAFETLRYNLIEGRNAFNWPSWLPIKPIDIRDAIVSRREELRRLRGKVDLVAGGPPCQGFSTAGRRVEHDERNQMFREYIKFVEFVQPRMILFENVPGFDMRFGGKEGNGHSYSTLLGNRLQQIGFEKPALRKIDFSEYGVPQFRKRIIIYSTQKGMDPETFFDRLLKRKSHSTISVMQATSDLLRSNGEVTSPDSPRFTNGVYGTPTTPFQIAMQKSNEKGLPDSHRFTRHSEKVEERFKFILESYSRGKNLDYVSRSNLGLKKRTIIPLDPKTPSPTLTTLPDDYIHYGEPRILTVREYARLQSFPEWYEFKGKYTTGGKLRTQETPRYTQVANAVPPKFSELAAFTLSILH